MTDVKVEQCDYDRAKPFFNEGGPAFPMLAAEFARHRQAAEKAQQERDAKIAEDPRNGLSAWRTRERIATAIRSQGHE